jgi:simple sugar transport system permease protein
VTTVYTVGIPPIATMVFKAAVVTAVCLLQSPTTAAALERWRSRLATRHLQGVAAKADAAR